MDIIGIICEYNPFHSGHEYQIRQSKLLLGQEPAVLCVMSGDFVQRGEAAVFSKYARAEAACRCGADVVIELPLPWSLSSAEGFANGAVTLLADLGAQHLCFGSEAGELAPLEHIARCITEPGFNDKVSERLRSNPALSYAMARHQLLDELLGEKEAEHISKANNILGVEYLKSIYTNGFTIKPTTVSRQGSTHDGVDGEDGKSAMELRRMMTQGQDLSPYIPAAAYDVFDRERRLGRTRREPDALDTALLSRLRMFDEEYYASIPDASDGAGQRLCRAATEQCSLNAIVGATRTKRYPISRVRRMIMCAALGIKRDMTAEPPPYARVLAANEKGCALLRELDGKSKVPLLTKPASVRQLSERAQKLFALGVSAHDLFVLGYTALEERKGGEDWRTGPKIV